MHTIMKAYTRLLADVCDKSEVPLAPPDDLQMAWVLHEAPALDKAILNWVETGFCYPSIPLWLEPLWQEFTCRAKREGTVCLSDDDPLHLEFVKHTDGTRPNRLDRPAGFFLKLVRQSLLFGYKASFEPTNEQLNVSQEAFIDAERGIDAWNAWFTTNSKHTHRTARRYIGKVIARCNWSEIIPKHGPGAVYPRRVPSAKGRFGTIYQSIEEVYPYYEYFEGLPNYWPDPREARKREDLIECDGIIANLVAVPKDSRGPRLICVHPAEAIWIQQGQRDVLERAIGRSPLTAGRIVFDDQTVNGGLALSSSASREYCTLDLREASDTISDELVRFLFGGAYKWIGCSRAGYSRLIDGRFIKLRKFAPMGNAITFPVESLVFWAMVRAGILARHGVDCGEVYVFGDDILFPSKYYDGAIWGLTSAGAKPNVSKTFRKGFFRESCGVDAFNGIDVTPHRLKEWESRSVTGLLSLCALAKNLRMDGFEYTASYLYSLVRKASGRLPLSNNPDTQGIYEFVDRGFDYLLRNEPSLSFDKRTHRWMISLQIPQQKVERLRTHARWHVQESLLGLSRSRDKTAVSSEARKGLVYPIPHRVSLKWGWSEVILR